MDRRTFVGAAAALTATAAVADAADSPKTGRDVYELRSYTLKTARRPILDAWLEKAFIPAVKRHGGGPVGVFAAPTADEMQRVFVLITHPNGESVTALPGKLATDTEYAKAAGEFLTATAADPVYARIESTILTAFAGMPRIEKPDVTKPRILNLRVYESHNERSAAKKVEMFEAGGELAIFRRVGLTPVMFASAVAGPALPNLTYLLVFPDEAGRKAAWDRFRGDAEWLKLKVTPGYADKEIVSRITDHILTPASFSEL